ncbi:TPA: hypothetical protein ACOECR_000891 [Stenotrophomonas maltophilia]
MAGKRQHYVPRFLQRGFLALDRQEGDGECTWWHFRGNLPRTLPISHIGVRENFYSRTAKNGERTLDDVITDRESRIQSDLLYARVSQAGEVLDAERIGPLVTHLVLRTAYIRSVFRDAGEKITEALIDGLGNADALRQLLGVDTPSPTSQARAIASGVVERLEAEGREIIPALLEREVAYHIRESFDDFIPEFDWTFGGFQAEIAEQLPMVIARSHQATLAEGNHSAWDSALSRLVWTKVSLQAVILPDCIAVARSTKMDWAPLLLVGTQDLDACILPLDHSSLLIGTANELVPVAAGELREICAACSDAFFIAASPMPELSARLGRRSEEVVLDLVQNAVEDAQPPTTPLPSTAAVAPSPPASPLREYTISLPASLSEERAALLIETVRKSVHEASATLPLHMLDGVTFASDYTKALQELDRGDPRLPALTSSPRPDGVGVGRCVSVSRNGVTKQHIVLGWPVAEGSFSDQPEEQRASAHTIAKMLVSACFDERHLLKDEGSASSATPFTLTLQRAVSTVPHQYYVARETARIDKDAGARHAAFISRYVPDVILAMQQAHIRYQASEDINDLLETALIHVGPLIEHVAQWCGHCDGSDQLSIDPQDPTPSMDGHELIQTALASLQLAKWSSLLHRDLRTLFQEPENFTTEHVLALTSHVERTLWSLGVHPWPMEDGQMYVTVGETP